MFFGYAGIVLKFCGVSETAETAEGAEFVSYVFAIEVG
jgi:hypothetical protein